MSYTFNREFALAANEGSSQKAQNLYVIAHETANPTATGRNEATFMKRNWRNAYTQFIIGDGGIIYLIGEPGYVAYGALSANPYSPVQIELQHTKDKTMFRKNYAAYIWLIRWACDKYNIPKTLDAGKAGTKGVKSHKWVSDNIEGDHQDPYSYLASMGISKAQFAKDIEKGMEVTTTMAKYATEPGTYEVIKVGSAGYEYLFDDVGRKSKRRVRLAKGSRIYFRELPKYGSIRVAKTAVGFMTANLEYVKKV
ncbi:N-acetylmuramoyl-L-alanine amidase [Enterococcus sp. SMC-9]|uniref:N-acetylmuramoyl-L-alanine amidase n=1 Tax=Enterococcus sp. SMC-9 TaxID=2862343 RepID=UPI003FA5ABD1